MEWGFNDHGPDGNFAACPLWVISGHDGANMRCLLYPRKQTSSFYEYTP